MKYNWRSTLGGALSALGKSLLGVGIVPQLGGVHSNVLTGIALAGFVIDGLGSFFGHLFAADAREVQRIAVQVQENSDAMRTGDTTMLTRRAVDVASGVIPPTVKPGV